MSQSPLFSREELADSAFELLTSSSIERYIRLAKAGAKRSSVHRRLRQEPHMVGSALDRAQALWKELLGSAHRDVAEFELALLLPLLADASEPAVDRLLLRLATADRPNVAWPAALARRLLMGRSTNMMAVTPGLDVRHWYQISVTEATCRHEQASSHDSILVAAA